jgi:hypothetical protein
LPSIYQLGSEFVKQLFRIQKGGKVLLLNHLKSRMELILVFICHFSCLQHDFLISSPFGLFYWQQKAFKALKTLYIVGIISHLIR